MSPGARAQLDPSRRLAEAGVALVGLVLATEIATHLVDYGVYRLRIEAMNANLGSSPVAWVSPVAIAVALAAAVMLARAGRARPLLCAALAVVLVLSTRHLGESLPHWQVLLLPPLGLALALLWRGADGLDRLAGRVARAGCVLLVVAFGLHVFGQPVLHLVGIGVDSWPYQVKVALKEGFEISGWLLIASGLAATALGARRYRAAATAAATSITP